MSLRESINVRRVLNLFKKKLVDADLWTEQNQEDYEKALRDLDDLEYDAWSVKGPY